MRTLWSRIRSLFRRDVLESRLDDEVRAHLQMLVAEYERRGLSPDEARLAARRAFGGIEPMKERYRDRRGLPWVDVLRQDGRDAWRHVARNPGFATAVVLTMMVCVGVNAGLFALLDAVVLRPLPYADSERLVAMHSRTEAFGRIPVHDDHFREWTRSARAVDALALSSSRSNGSSST